MPGDKVKIVAYAKFSNLTGTASNLSNFATALLSAFGASTPLGGEVGTASSALNTYGGIVASGNGPTSTGPKAFVNILVFDKNYNFLDVTYQAIDPTAAQVGLSPVVPHDSIGAEYTIKEAGYIYMYVSNENPTRVDVYFDDIVMTHTPGNVIQYNEYYPFGMRTAASWDRVEDKPMPSMATNLAAKIDFDGNANDRSGNGNNGTLGGGALLKTDEGRPNVVVVDGTDDYVQVNDSPTLDFGANNFTVAIWAKKLTATVSAWDNSVAVNKWYYTGSAGANEWSLQMATASTNDIPAMYVEMGTTIYSVASNEAMVVGRWYHLLAQREGTLLKLYVNGVLKGSTNIGGGAINNCAGRNLLIGKTLYAGQSPTHGAFDDLHIYNRAINEEEIRALYLDRPDLMVNGYLYNAGSELNDQTGSYEMYFRNYDPVLGRMSGVDVMADYYSSLTPYNYSFNDPVFWNDPMGDCPECQYQRSDDTWWVAPRSEVGGKYAGFGSFESWAFQNQGNWVPESDSWAWTGMSSDNVYGDGQMERFGAGYVPGSYEGTGLDKAEVWVDYYTVTSLRSTGQILGVKYSDSEFKGYRYTNDKAHRNVGGQNNGSGPRLMAMGLNLQPGDPLWDAISDYMTGIGMAVDGAAFRLGVALNKRLAYEFTRTSYHGFQVKTPPVNFRTPFGGVNIPTGLVKGAANALKVGGAGLGVLGLGMTTYEIYTGEKSFLGEGGLDLIMGGVAFVPGGGWIISGLYFGGKWALEATGNDFWNKP